MQLLLFLVSNNMCPSITSPIYVVLDSTFMVLQSNLFEKELFFIKY